MQWELITNIILISSIITFGIFVIMGLCQLIMRKSFMKVDKEIRWMPLPLALMTIVYFVFDKLVILSTRPDGSGKSSFPSSHAMVATTIFFIVTLILPHYVKNGTIRVILEIIMVIAICLVCAGRVLAGKHSVIDVIAAIIFAFIFSEIYYLIIKKRKHGEHIHENN